MSIISRIGEIIWGEDKASIQTLDLKSAFEQNRVGVNGRPQMPEVDRLSLMNRQRTNELVYACIRKKCEAAADPELIVERVNKKGEWEKVDGHPIISLLKKPNRIDTYDSFLAAWIGSEETTGDFYAEIIRDRTGKPCNLYPLNPARMKPIPQGADIVAFEFDAGNGKPVRLDAKDVLHRRKPDLLSRFFGLSPLRVAVGSVAADQAQTDFIRAFFDSDGIPAGFLKVRNRTMSQEEADAIQQDWMRKYSRGGTNYKQIGILDENSDYESIGSNLHDIEADIVRMQNEARICSVFGVPPALIGAYVGLKLATNNATMRSHLVDFWDNTMSPQLKSMRVFLTWNLLSQFEPIEDIKAGQVRVAYDMSTVMALQEDESERHTRARENVKAGIWLIDEGREATGKEPLPNGQGQIFLRPSSAKPASAENQLEEAELVPLQIGDGTAATATVDGEVVDDGKTKNLHSELLKAITDIEKHPDYVAPNLIKPVSRWKINDAGELVRDVSVEFDNSDLKRLFTPIDEFKENLKTPEGIQKEIDKLPIVHFCSSEAKKIEYDGLTVSRQPTETEKLLDLKGMDKTFADEKENLVKVLQSLKSDLIKQSAEAARSLNDKEVYALTLAPAPKAYDKVRKVLESAFDEGRKQVIRDLKIQSEKTLDFNFQFKNLGDDIKEILTKLSDLTVARIVNEIQKSAINWFTSLSILGKNREEIAGEMVEELGNQAMKFVETYAGAAVNAATQAGRKAEINAREDEWKHLEYSAILDPNCCPNCSEWDGKQAQSVEDLPDTPNPECDGKDLCRCFIVAVVI